MNIVCKCALVGASLLAAYACANPVDITGDVLIADPSDFGDGGIVPGTGGTTGTGVGGTGGTAGTNASTGGTGAGVGGAGAGVGGTGAGVGGAGSGTGGTGAGLGGTGTGGTGTGGTGTGGTGAGTGGTGAGTGGTGSEATFDPADCNFDDETGCANLACNVACGSNNNFCTTNCPQIITCVSAAPECITVDDPLCGKRIGQSSTENTCTSEVESSGGADPDPPAGSAAPMPSFVARQFVECICSNPRP